MLMKLTPEERERCRKNCAASDMKEETKKLVKRENKKEQKSIREGEKVRKWENSAFQPKISSVRGPLKDISFST